MGHNEVSDQREAPRLAGRLPGRNGSIKCGPRLPRAPKKVSFISRPTQKMHTLAVEKATRHYTQQSVKLSIDTSIRSLSLVQRRHTNLNPQSLLHEQEIGH